MMLGTEPRGGVQSLSSSGGQSFSARAKQHKFFDLADGEITLGRKREGIVQPSQLGVGNGLEVTLAEVTQCGTVSEVARRDTLLPSVSIRHRQMSRAHKSKGSEPSSPAHTLGSPITGCCSPSCSDRSNDTNCRLRFPRLRTFNMRSIFR